MPVEPAMMVMLYLNLTARNDWSSTLPINANSYFYPGATLSWIFTQLLPKNDILEFGKLRLAYGKTGNDADPYQTAVRFIQGTSRAYYGTDFQAFGFVTLMVNFAYMGGSQSNLVTV